VDDVSDTAIRVENLGKKYVLSHQQTGGSGNYNSLRDSIADKAKSLSEKLLKPSGKKTFNPTREEFWALKDVSFEIKQGDRVGIIGRNGAGKSTLLKILSRIVEPTNGKISIKGRIASLLEVGTGFHPELTGRENVFLNGAILGMSKEEIKRKFDEIVAFAEVEKFLDTPVKRYSSGMYVRLAFAVAAHLEPEILIVDEVLAVGDSNFQKKCLGKMEDVANEGRTILFVSHSMDTVTRLCNHAILLKQGTVQFAEEQIKQLIHILNPILEQLQGAGGMISIERQAMMLYALLKSELIERMVRLLIVLT
jgi:lipopolysaccharide transport system ATP-binding protein